MELEEAVKILEDFKIRNIERDKLEPFPGGCLKLGIRYYTTVSRAIEVILEELEKDDYIINKQDRDIVVLSKANHEKNKVIEEIAKDYAETMQSIKHDYSPVNEIFLNKESIKQYFYKKVEAKNNV